MRRRRILWFCRAVALVMLLAMVFAGFVCGYHGLASARIIRSHLAFAERMGSGSVAGAELGPEVDALQSDLAALQSHLTSIRRYGAPWLWFMQRAGRLPVLGADVRALPYLLETSIELVTAARSGAALLPSLLETAAPRDAPSGRPASQALLDVLRDNGPALQSARRHLAAAQAVSSHMRTQSFRTTVGSYVQHLERYERLLEMAVEMADVFPAAIGNERPRTYLLIAQNSDELRATGGFLSAAGTVTLDRGWVMQFSLQDSYAGDDLTVPHPAPPEPLLRYMDIGVLLLRDVNWWPDFPTSAAMAMQVWESDGNQQVDGVIALDLEGMRLLLEGLGPVKVAGEEQPIDAGELTQILRQKWGIVPEGVEEMGAWFLQRKDFWPLLAGGVLAKLQGDLGTDNLPRLARALKSAIDSKHLQVYANDPSLQSLITRLGADGSVRPTPGDYLMIVDSNVGFNKVNPNIGQSIEYAVNLADAEHVQAGLTIRYTNNATIRLPECVYGPAYGLTYDDMLQRCYWDYVRVYAPAGSIALLTRDSPDVEVSREGDKRTFASYFVLAPGESYSLHLDYLLPQGAVQAIGQTYRYTLLVQKQGGTAGHALRLSLALPHGARLLAASPQPNSVAGGTLIFGTTLDRDLTFEVTYVP